MKKDTNIERRKFLKMAGLTAGIGASFGFGFKQSDSDVITPQTKSHDLSFKPVKVSSDRVIRTIVGLRPFRPSGFILKSERLNDKTIIHNYGHGGGGVSLSWGTAKLAVDLALQTQETSIAVLGCGVIGLSTARLLQRKGLSGYDICQRLTSRNHLQCGRCNVGSCIRL